ncbi:MAG: dihydropteroate synthase [Candidatus Muirbacterium halophilum]|nr:dihydropteroate synthase [Candidatus Muirbacterium halophilum]MCK9475345.1 dihydropteroate synthase [Candidatus Muirbacterium halophilum]
MDIFSGFLENKYRKEIKKTGISKAGDEIFKQKSQKYALLLKNISLAKALVLKQELLVCGGDCALHENAVRGILKTLNIVISADIRTLSKLETRLKTQGFFEKERKDILNFINSQKDSELFTLRNKKFVNNNTYIMAILNVTPDSFSDGGLNLDEKTCIENIKKMIETKVDIIDVGGESTRPSAKSVSIEEELDRVIPKIRLIRSMTDIPISIDTYKHEVAREALENGADSINYVRGYEIDENMLKVVYDFKTPFFLMHSRGNSANMQKMTEYSDIVEDIFDEINNSYEKLLQVLDNRKKIIIDPGIGFAKTTEQNWEIISKVKSFFKYGSPVLMGVSRKSFIKNSFDIKDNILKDEITDILSMFFTFSGVNFIRVHNYEKAYRLKKIMSFLEQ